MGSTWWLELRTKSTQVRQLLGMEVARRCVAAFSFTPEPIARATEHGTPNLTQRIEAMRKLEAQGEIVIGSGARGDMLV